MKRKTKRNRIKKIRNICSASLVLLLLAQTGLFAAGANEVVKDEGTEECVEIQLPVEQQQQFVSEDDVVSVSMPLQTPFTMNPTRSFGEEQIWSPMFHFQNNSRTAVEVTIKNIRYVLKENSTVVTHYQPFDGLEERKKKELYLCLMFGETEVPVGDLSREYRFTLEKAGEGAGCIQEFSIGGMMSCYPEEEWLDGDAAIAFQVEYKRLPEPQTQIAEKAVNAEMPKGGEENAQAANGKQAASENTGISLTKVQNPEWQEDLIGVILAENVQLGMESLPAEKQAEATDIRAYIIDSGRTEDFPFDWKKILDDYEKYADAIPEGTVLILDANTAAGTPAAYAEKEGLKKVTPEQFSKGAVYAFWRNPDYIPENNKVWHIEEDVPYYISNPEQPWLWSAADGDVPADADPVFLWIMQEEAIGTARSGMDASLGVSQDMRRKEGNAEYEPGNNTGDTAAE